MSRKENKGKKKKINKKYTMALTFENHCVVVCINRVCRKRKIGLGNIWIVEVFLYTYREKEGEIEREREMRARAHTHTHTHTHVCVHIYRETS